MINGETNSLNDLPEIYESSKNILTPWEYNKVVNNVFWELALAIQHKK